MRGAAKSAFAVSNVIPENGGSSSDMFLVDLAENVEGSYSAKATLGRRFAKIVDENAFKESAALCVPGARNAQK